MKKYFKKYHLYPLILAFIIFFHFIYKQTILKTSWQHLVRKQIGSYDTTSENLFFDDQQLFFSNRVNAIYAIKQSTGRLNWRFISDGYTPFKILIEDKYLFVANFDAHIYCLNKNNGQIIWTFAIPQQFIPDTEVIGSPKDELVFFADRGGNLRALNKKTGNLIWTKQFKTIDTNKQFVDGTIHFGSIEERGEYLYINNFPEEKFISWPFVGVINFYIYIFS